MRPIDAEALKDEFCAHCATLKRYKRTVEECRNYIDPDGNRCFKMRYIDSSPTIEAEPVVRCEHCTHSRDRNDGEKQYLIDGVLICTSSDASDVCWNPVYPTHFCSYGERKEATP